MTKLDEKVVEFTEMVTWLEGNRELVFTLRRIRGNLLTAEKNMRQALSKLDATDPIYTTLETLAGQAQIMASDLGQWDFKTFQERYAFLYDPICTALQVPDDVGWDISTTNAVQGLVDRYRAVWRQSNV